MSNLSRFFLILRNNFFVILFQFFVSIFVSVFSFFQSLDNFATNFATKNNSKKFLKSGNLSIDSDSNSKENISLVENTNSDLTENYTVNSNKNYWLVLKFWTSVFCQVVLVFGMTFGVLASVPVYAEEDDGVIGFSACRFGSAEVIRANGQAGGTPGNEAFRQCLRQILTFVFVLGVFLIGMRIAIEAFKGLNPMISGNAINNSVKLGQDIIIGLVLIGAPSIFLGVFNEAALQLPNLFELAQFRPGAEKKNSSTTPSSTTPGAGSGTTGTGGTSGTGGTATPSGGLTLPDGTKISKEDLDKALKQRDDDPAKLTPLQIRILEEFDKRPKPGSASKIWVSENFPEVDKDEVTQALTEAQKHAKDTSNTLAQKGVLYARGLARSCLSSSQKSMGESDTAACGLIRSLQLTDPIYRVDYNSGQDFMLANGWSRTNYAPAGSATTGKKDNDITLKNGSQELLVKLRCDNAASAQQSLLTQATFSYTPGRQSLNAPGCTIEANFTKT